MTDKRNGDEEGTREKMAVSQLFGYGYAHTLWGGLQVGHTYEVVIIDKKYNGSTTWEDFKDFALTVYSA